MNRSSSRKGLQRQLAIVVFHVLVLLSATQVRATELPEGWPWHGMNLDSATSTPTDVVRFQTRLGIDTVRLQLKPEKLMEQRKLSPTQAWNESMEWLDAMLDRCKDSNIRAIVDLSHFPVIPSKALNRKYRYAQYAPEFWSDARQLDDVVTAVSRLMVHLRGRGPEFAALEIMSEPAIRVGPQLEVPKEWEPLMKRVIATIRAERPRLWILLSPPPQGLVDSFERFEPWQDSYIIYNTHIYQPSKFAAQGIGGNEYGPTYPGVIAGKQWDAQSLKAAMNPLRQFQLKHGVPVIVGEFSAVRWARGGEQYIKDLRTIFDSFGWGWLYFSGTGWHGWNPDYNQNYPGKDFNGPGWRKDHIGEGSARWQTLENIFRAPPLGD